MSRQKPIDLNNPEWTAEDFSKARAASDLPDHIREAFPRTRAAQKASTKVPVSIRLSLEVIAHFKADGPGWQSRIDEALRKLAKVT